MFRFMTPSVITNSHHRVGRSRIESMFHENRQDLDFEDVERCSACVRKASCAIIRRYSAGKHKVGEGR